jgi:hypothetical protein
MKLPRILERIHVHPTGHAEVVDAIQDSVADTYGKMIGAIDDRLQAIIDHMVEETGCTPEDAAATLVHLYTSGGASPYDITSSFEGDRVVFTARVPILPETPRPPEAV